MGSDPLANPEEAVRRVYAYVAYRIGAGPDAEDVASETIERALRYRSSFDPRRGSAAGWLVGIAANCLNDRHRSGGGNVEFDVAQLPGSESDFAGRIDDGLDLRAAVARLDERDRELIGLRYGADLKAKEIGGLLGMKPNAVEVALHRALGRLREALGG